MKKNIRYNVLLLLLVVEVALIPALLLLKWQK